MIIQAIILILAGTFFSELGAVKMKKLWAQISPFQKGLILTFFQTLTTLLLLLFTQNRVFEVTVLSIAFTIFLIIWGYLFKVFMIKAIETADRSTNSIFSILAIPLILIGDLVIWYDVNIYQIIWVLFITVVLLITSFSWTISLKWVKYVLIANIVWFLNVTFLKYNITHFTSVESLIFTISIFTFLVFFFDILFREWIRPIINCIDKNYVIFGVFAGINGILVNFAYLFGPASIINAIKKVWLMLWWVIFGKLIFKEINFIRKFSSVSVLGFWVFIMNFQAFAGNIEFLTSINTKLLQWDISWYKKDLNKNIDKEKFSKNLQQNQEVFPY